MRKIIFFCIIISLSLVAVQIQIENEILDVEIADTPTKWAKGLQMRNELPDGKGMLFVYPNARRLSFWMKNTLIPLSIAFFDENRTMLNILDMDLPSGQNLRYRSTAPALYALEVPLGWFERHGIKSGAQFSFVD